MDRLNQLSQYFKEKEKKKLQEINRDVNGLPEMTLSEIKLSCLENDGYDAPELNDKLYLHFRGFKKIQNLDFYTNCKSIWLDSNGLEIIEGLDKLQELRCLFLSKNLISSIDGLYSLKNLNVLDLSYNRITKLENLSCCPLLQTLNASRNALFGADSIEHLKECESLQTVDLTHNRLESEDILLSLKNVPNLVTLSLNGNEMTKLPSFRKKLIYMIPKLGYLDRPIEEIEKLAANAFMNGGPEAETEARNKYREMKAKEKKDEMAAFREWQLSHKQKRIEMRAAGHKFITEFTPEELKAREEQAHKDALAEKEFVNRLLYGGVGPRDEELDPSPIIDIKVTDNVDEPTIEENNNELNVQLSKSDQEANNSKESNISPNIESPVNMCQDQVDHEIHLDTNLVKENDTKFDSSSDQENLPPVENILTNSFNEEEEIRAKRVAESLEIFRSEGNLSSLPNQNVRTWDNKTTFLPPPPPSSMLDESKKPIYWSEEMDLHLAKFVREFRFNFDAIADNIKKLANEGAFGLLTKLSPERINAEECRLRWSQLDAQEWSKLAPNTSSLDTIHEIFIQASVCTSEGHGSQPSFDALKSMASSSAPKYLKQPKSFPSMSDTEFSVDDDYDDNGDIIPLKIPTISESIAKMKTLD